MVFWGLGERVSKLSLSSPSGHQYQNQQKRFNHAQGTNSRLSYIDISSSNIKRVRKLMLLNA